jgi:hypothetical protein
MRLFIDTHYFISVIEERDTYNCQVMALIHGMGYYPANITDDQSDVVSVIVHEGFTETSKYCNNLQEIADFQLQCLNDLYIQNCLIRSLESSYEVV